MNRSARLAVFGLVAFLAFAWGATAWGCPVCFGESDAPIVKGVEMSVLFMIGITYSLMFGGAATFFVMRRRALQGVQPTNERAATALKSLE